MKITLNKAIKDKVRYKHTHYLTMNKMIVYFNWSAR